MAQTGQAGESSDRESESARSRRPFHIRLCQSSPPEGHPIGSAYFAYDARPPCLWPLSGRRGCELWVCPLAAAPGAGAVSPPWQRGPLASLVLSCGALGSVHAHRRTNTVLAVRPRPSGEVIRVSWRTTHVAMGAEPGPGARVTNWGMCSDPGASAQRRLKGYSQRTEIAEGSGSLLSGHLESTDGDPTEPNPCSWSVSGPCVHFSGDPAP